MQTYIRLVNVVEEVFVHVLLFVCSGTGTHLLDHFLLKAKKAQSPERECASVWAYVRVCVSRKK